MVKNLPARRFNVWVMKIPWRRDWQLTPVFMGGEFHEQRSLAGYSQWDGKRSDMSGQPYFNTFHYIVDSFCFTAETNAIV